MQNSFRAKLLQLLFSAFPMMLIMLLFIFPGCNKGPEPKGFNYPSEGWTEYEPVEVPIGYIGSSMTTYSACPPLEELDNLYYDYDLKDKFKQEHLQHEFSLEKLTYKLGEPIEVTFTIRLDCFGAWHESYFNEYTDFAFLIRKGSSTWLPDNRRNYLYSRGLVPWHNVKIRTPLVRKCELVKRFDIVEPGIYDVHCFYRRDHKTGVTYSPLTAKFPKKIKKYCQEFHQIDFIEYLKTNGVDDEWCKEYYDRRENVSQIEYASAYAHVQIEILP